MLIACRDFGPHSYSLYFLSSTWAGLVQSISCRAIGPSSEWFGTKPYIFEKKTQVLSLSFRLSTPYYGSNLGPDLSSYPAHDLFSNAGPPTVQLFPLIYKVAPDTCGSNQLPQHIPTTRLIVNQ